jgi:predicted CopG family antitoxin
LFSSHSELFVRSIKPKEYGIEVLRITIASLTNDQVEEKLKAFLSKKDLKATLNKKPWKLTKAYKTKYNSVVKAHKFEVLD